MMITRDNGYAINQQAVEGRKHNQEVCKERDAYIDLCRATAFVLVVLHHSGIGRLGKYILGFHMPVFFIIAGLTFNVIHAENRDVKLFSIKRFRQLVVPYFEFELLNLGLTWLLEAASIGSYHAPLLPAAKSILRCINNSAYIGISLRLWFLPCMALSSIVFVAILSLAKAGKKNAACFFLMCFSLFAHYMLQVFLHKRLPFTLDISLLAVFYIAFGYVFKESLYKLILSCT